MTVSVPKKFWVSCLFLSAAYILFMGALVGDAELDGGDDFNHVAVACWVPWSSVAEAFVFYKKPGNLLGSGLTQHALSNRVGQTAALKILHRFFGSNPRPYFLFQTLVGALCLVLLGWIVMALTRSYLLAMFAALFYFFLPSAFLHNIWLSDFAEVVHLSVLISFSCLYLWSQGGGRRWLFLAAAVAFYACKSKPSAFVIPLVSAVFLALNFKKFKKGAWVLAAFFAVLVFGAVFFGRELWGLAQSLRWENIPRMLFLNTENEFEPERSLALFDIKSVVPVSLARNLNFFFLWLVIFSVALLFKKGRFRFEKPVQFVWLWFAAEAASFAFADSAPRYLTDILLPAVILMCVLFQKACDELRSKKRRLVFGAVFLAGFLFGVIGNVQHLIFLRDWKIGYFYSLSKPAQVIWNHENRRPLDARVPIETLVPFAWPALTSEIDATLLQGSPRKKKSPEVTLPELLAFSDLADMYPASYDPQRARAFSSGREVVYGVSFKEETPKGFSVLTSLPAVPPSPITDALKGFKHKKRNERLWIFVRGA